MTESNPLTPEQALFKKMFEEFDINWVKPELERRFGAEIPENFKVWHCRVLFPKDGNKAVIEFNSEVGWAIENSEMAKGTLLEPGKEVGIHDLQTLGRVLPPIHNEERVAFIWLYWGGFHYNFYFDFLPNQPDFDPADPRFSFDDAVIKNYLLAWLTEQTARLSQAHYEQLKQQGIWIATALLPFNLAQILEKLGNDDFEAINTFMLDTCSPEYIEELVNTWQPINCFVDRVEVFREATLSFRDNRFASVVTLLSVHIEGVILDWLIHLGKGKKAKSDIDKVVEEFGKLLDEIPNLELAYRYAKDSLIDVMESLLLKKFRRGGKINPSFPQRHAIAHGVSDHRLFTQLNCVKLFLLFDSICQFMMFYEVRVLGKDLGK